MDRRPRASALASLSSIVDVSATVNSMGNAWLEVVLVEPQIPPNTGNIIRLCANTGARLHLVGPLGFRLNDRALARAKLDYAALEDVVRHRDWRGVREMLGERRFFALTTRAQRRYSDVRFAQGDVVVFGAETHGLAPEILNELGTDAMLRLPMRVTSRSLNLANAVAVVVYEAWRQLAFAGGR